MLSNSVKFGKINATAFAHSQAQQIKSFVNMKQKVPNLLSRGAERFMGKGQMFRGLATSTKGKSIFDGGLNDDGVIDVPLHSGARENHEQKLFSSISHLKKLPNDNKLKNSAMVNQQEFKNPVAFAQR